MDALGQINPDRLGWLSNLFAIARARHGGARRRIQESRPDGTKFLLTPERSIAMQCAIGSDIMMVLDQCINSTSAHAEARAAMELTHRWAARSLAARADSPNALFAIVQGACFTDLRRMSADALTNMAPPAATDRRGSTALRSAGWRLAKANMNAKT